LRIFRARGKSAVQLAVSPIGDEKSLQALIERHLPTFLGIRLLASQYPTGRTHRGRIDTLGLALDGTPVIVEYKRAVIANLINQSLFYLDWLLDHRAEYRLLVEQRFGTRTADRIEWAAPRLICIAADFTRYDRYAIKHIDQHIEMVRYRMFTGELLLLERVEEERRGVLCERRKTMAQSGRRGSRAKRPIASRISVR